MSQLSDRISREAGIQVLHDVRQAPTVKTVAFSPQIPIIPNRRDALLKTLDHLEAQAGRLMKMARDVRAEVLSLTIED